MNLSLQKRLAARTLECSPKRVSFDTTKLAEIKKAIRKVDIRNLIGQGAIKKNPIRGISRARAKFHAKQIVKGRRRGHGSRKGKKTARQPSKRAWINRIRALREILKNLRDKNLIPKAVYRELYMKAKGNFFRSRRHLRLYIKEHNLIKNG